MKSAVSLTRLNIIGDLAPDTTFYKQGEYMLTCALALMPLGTHQGVLRLKPTSISGAYWKADKNEQDAHQNYGVAFGSKDELFAQYLKMIEEGRSATRKMGCEMELFMMSDFGPGFHSGFQTVGVVS